MSSPLLLVIAMFSIIIWIVVSKELLKPAKQLNKQKLITLVATGFLTTFIITWSFVQKLIA